MRTRWTERRDLDAGSLEPARAAGGRSTRSDSSMRRSALRTALGCAVVLACVGAPGSTPLYGQDNASGGVRPQVACFRGRPLPACKSFWIVEMQGSAPLAQTRRVVYYDVAMPIRDPALESALEWNLGHMVNLGDRWAAGGVVTVGTGNSDPLTGLKARARRWLSPDISIELEAGLLRSNASDTQFPGVNGGTADLRLNIRDQGSFFVRWDVLSLPEQDFPAYSSYYDPGGIHHGVGIGVAAGSVPALVGTGGLGLVYAVLLGIFVAADR